MQPVIEKIGFCFPKLCIKKGHFLLPLTQLINILYKILKQHFSIEQFLGEKKIVKSIRKCIFRFKVFSSSPKFSMDMSSVFLLMLMLMLLVVLSQ